MGGSSKKIKVLIVEDDEIVRKIYAKTFMRSGFTVYTASDGGLAIEKYKSKKPDIILLDIIMPNVNGYEVLNKIRSNLNSYIPIIMLTNLGADSFKRESQLDNIDAYLIKLQYSPQEIVNKTIEVLRKNQTMVN